MAAVIAVLLILMAAGIRLGGSPTSASRKTATDLVSGLVDAARATAIGRRTPVLLALAAPDDLPAGSDGRYRIGMFQITADERGEGFLTELANHDAIQLGRWKAIERGLVFEVGGGSGLMNPMDEPAIDILVRGSGTIRVHGVILDRHGGIRWPAGSVPVAIRIDEGRLKQGKAEVLPSGGTVAGNLLRIGRHNGRTYQIDR